MKKSLEQLFFYYICIQNYYFNKLNMKKVVNKLVLNKVSVSNVGKFVGGVDLDTYLAPCKDSLIVRDDSYWAPCKDSGIVRFKL